MFQLEKTDLSAFRPDLRLMSFTDVLQAGEHSSVAASPPTSQDVAILMCVGQRCFRSDMVGRVGLCWE